MNKDILQGNWTRLKGQLLQQWGKLTRDEKEIAQGSAEVFTGRLQARYGWARQHAKIRLNEMDAGEPLLQTSVTSTRH